jgi:hypothetical protein
MSTPPAAIQAVLNLMTGKTVTLGWDVVAGYGASSVNELFAQQFVTNVRANQNLAPITANVQVGNTEVQLQNVVLGPPLISFSETVGTQQAIVQMNFVSGNVIVMSQSGPIQYVTGYQSIVPGDQYVLQMVVNLLQVQGEVTSNKAVIVDLQNASNYTANLVAGASGAEYLGQYFQEFFQKEAAGTLTYQLGSVTFGTSENLTPVSFEIRTQPKGSSGSDGAVLLLVATNYNPNGGNLPGSGYPYLIPSGYGAVLVVQSSTLFGKLMPAFYSKNMSGSPTFETNVLSGSNAASYLTFTGGSASAGIVKGNWSSGETVSHQVWSGSPGDFLGGNPGYQAATVPYTGLSLEPSNNLLAVNWSTSWSQLFTGWTMISQDGVQSASDSHLTLTISNASYIATPSVDASTDVVSFTGSGGTPDVTFTHSSWIDKWFGNGDARDEAAMTLANAAAPEAKKVLNAQIPQVDTFAVSNLLFPGSNVMQFSDVYVPGDLALFGNIAPSQTAFSISPLQSVIGAGEPQQFTVSTGATVTWGYNPRIGTMLQSGLYTAPSAVPNAIPIVITATDSNNDVSTAIVTVVPQAVSVSPSFAMLFPNQPPVAFSAAVVGNLGTPTWSISPDDGSAGTISSSGVYTPPASFTQIVGATITATAGSEGASAVIALVPDPIAIDVTPNFVTLQAGAPQQFTVPGSNTVNWSVIPTTGAGTIDSNGNYTPPLTITQNMTAFIVATASAFGDTYAGGGVVALTPSTMA